MLIDAHAHWNRGDLENGISEFLGEQKIFSLVCGSDPQDCGKIDLLSRGNPYMLPTFGIHPWQAGNTLIKELMPYLEKAAVIGEIGLDSVWCDVPISLQEKVFIEQLEIAERRNCPVILHTKGQEKRVAEIVQNYSMPVLVHWFSDEGDLASENGREGSSSGQVYDSLEMFLEQDHYFTVGPDFETNAAVRDLVRRVPLNRLFVETDGLSALEWVFHRNSALGDVEKALKSSMNFVAKTKKISTASVERAMEKNLFRFCGMNLQKLP